MSTETASLDSLVAEIGLAMTARHVPSQYNPKAPSEEFQGIKWECTLKTPRGSFSVPYTQGIGHLPEEVYKPKWNGGIANHELDKINHALQTGRIGLGTRRIAEPTLYDVLGCLCSDSRALDDTFESWAADYDYDTDSRKAEATYNACRETGLNLLRIIGPDKFDAVREAVSEAGF